MRKALRAIWEYLCRIVVIILVDISLLALAIFAPMRMSDVFVEISEEVKKQKKKVKKAKK